MSPRLLYRLAVQKDRITVHKRLLKALSELEQLKHVVQKKIHDFNRKPTFLENWQAPVNQSGSCESSPIELPRVTQQTKDTQPAPRETISQALLTHASKFSALI